jgi:hypothetical protein
MMKPAMSFVVLCGISLLFIQQAPAEAPELMDQSLQIMKLLACKS